MHLCLDKVKPQKLTSLLIAVNILIQACLYP